MKAHFIGGPKDGHTVDVDGPLTPTLGFPVPVHGPARMGRGPDPITYERTDKKRPDGSIVYIWPPLKDRL